MTTDLMSDPMPKAGRPKKPGGEGTLVRIDSDIVSRARYLSAQLDIPMSELLSNILRTEIDRQFRKVTREVLEAEEQAGRDRADMQRSEDFNNMVSDPPKPPEQPKG